VARPLTGVTRTSEKAPWAELNERPSFGIQTSSSKGAPGVSCASTTSRAWRVPTIIAQMSSESWKPPF